MEQLKDKLISSHFTQKFTEKRGGYVNSQRMEGIEIFQKEGFPTVKNEEWKYTNLKPLLKTDYKVNFKSEDAEGLDFKDVKKYFLNEIDSYKIVFVNGFFSDFLSETTHHENDICTLSGALKKDDDQAVIENYYNKSPNKNESLFALNTSFAKEGAYIRISDNVILDKPIQIIHFTTGLQTDIIYQPRNLVVVGRGSKVTITESHQNLSSVKTLTNSVTEIYCHQNAHLDYYKIQNDTLESSLIDYTSIIQERDSMAAVSTFSFGGKLTRNNLNFYHRGENITSKLYGATIIGEKQTVDHHTLVDHFEPNCESFENYKGIYDGQSRGVFNGKVMVHQKAQKTNAFQQNNNVLLSDNARIDTKPQLEIFADDVKCSHGCTVGQLDEKMLFYMRARGIGEKEARGLLLYAFANEALSLIQIPELKNRIDSLIADKLGVNIDFDL